MWIVEEIDNGCWRIVNVDGVLRIDRIFDSHCEAEEKCEYLNEGTCERCCRKCKS